MVSPTALLVLKTMVVGVSGVGPGSGPGFGPGSGPDSFEQPTNARVANAKIAKIFFIVFKF
jgi:hypothetical protein